MPAGRDRPADQGQDRARRRPAQRKCWRTCASWRWACIPGPCPSMAWPGPWPGWPTAHPFRWRSAWPPVGWLRRSRRPPTLSVPKGSRTSRSTRRRSRAAISVTSGAGTIVIVVSDDGVGGADPATGVGADGTRGPGRGAGGHVPRGEHTGPRNAPGRRDSARRPGTLIPVRSGLADLRPGMRRPDERVPRIHRLHRRQMEVALAVDRVGERRGRG